MAKQQLLDAEENMTVGSHGLRLPDNVAPTIPISQFQPLSLQDVIWIILPPDRVYMPSLRF